MYILHEFVALSGKMGSGKSTLTQFFVEKLGFHVVSIGSTIKDLSKSLIENKEEEMDFFLSSLSQNSKQYQEALENLGNIRCAYNVEEFQKDEHGVYLKTDSYRKFLQDLATDMRKHYGETVWVQYALEKYKHLSPFIIDDLRLKVEKQYLEENRFISLRLDIEKEEQLRRLRNIYGEVSEKQLNHVTEIDLDNESFFHRVDVTHQTPLDIFEAFKPFVTKKTS